MNLGRRMIPSIKNSLEANKYNRLRLLNNEKKV